MSKNEFLDRLRGALAGLPQDDIEERVTFYSEMIDDRVEDGLSEEEAAAEMGEVEDIARQTLEDIPLARLIKDKVKPNRKMKAWEMVLLVLGSPVWVPLVISAFAVLFSLFVVLWSLVLCCWAVALSFAAAGVCGFVGGIYNICRGETANGIAMIGAGLLLAGLAILVCFASKAATKGAFTLTKKTVLWIKTLIVGKEKTK